MPSITIDNVVNPAASTIQAPTTNTYTTPADAVTTTPTVTNPADTGYQAPASTFQANNINAGLLEYTPDASKDLTFDGRAIDASAVGANVSNITPNFQASSNYLTDGAFVENRMNGLLEDENSVTMQRARAQGLADAGTRQLQNTTMGATIGQAVMADKALQIASPDALTQATADMNRQTATYQAQRANQDAANQGSLAQQTAAINSALNAQTAGQTWDSTQQKSALQGDLNKQNANIAGAQTTQNAQYAQDATRLAGEVSGAAAQQQGNISANLAKLESVSSQNLATLTAKLEASHQTTADQNSAILQQFSAQQTYQNNIISNEYSKAVSQAQLNGNQQNALAEAMTTMAKDYEVSCQNILLDMNLTSDGKNAALAKMNTIFNADMANIARVFGASYANA